MTIKAPMLSVQEALGFLLKAARPVAETQIVPTLEGTGRVLAADQQSQLDVQKKKIKKGKKK